MRVREQLLQGASQIKLVGGGGVSSPRTALDMTTFSEPELRAASRPPRTGTPMSPCTPMRRRRSSARSPPARSASSTRHLMDEATAKLMADKGVWLSIQPFLSEEDTGPLTGQSRINAAQVFAGTDTAYRAGERAQDQDGVRLGYAVFRDAGDAPGGHADPSHAAGTTNAEILTMATATNGELLALSGPRNPYPGQARRHRRGALADLLVVDGDPLQNIALLATPATSLKLIMKGGVIYKDVLSL